MSDPGWWERHLSGALRPSTQQNGHGSPPDAGGLPLNGSPQQKAVRWQPQYPPTGPRQEVAWESQPGGEPDDNWHRVRSHGYVAKAPQSLGLTSRCPGCGGSNFFRRRGVMGVEAAPLCTDCGYNGEHFTQSGTLLNAIGMRSSGPVSFARSDNPGAESNFGVDASITNDFDWGAVR